MANALYPKGKEKLLQAQLNVVSASIKALLIPNSYTFDSTDEFLSDIGTTLGTAQTLGTKTVVDGVFDAADITFAALTAGNGVKGVILYADSGVAASSALLAYIDTITGFPFTTNGGDALVQWDNGAYKIFSL